jgi:hypothetical protein
MSTSAARAIEESLTGGISTWCSRAISTPNPTLPVCASGPAARPGLHECLLPGRLGEYPPCGTRSHRIGAQPTRRRVRSVAPTRLWIDYVLRARGEHGRPTLEISACQRAFDEPIDGVWASDHFGVVAILAVPTRRPTG